MRVVAFATFVAGVLPMSACGGLGDPVVDLRRGYTTDGGECRSRRPRCDDQLGAPEQLEVGADASETRARALPPCELGGAGASARIVTNLSDCTLTFSARDGEERLITDSSLSNVRIELEGDVTLQIVDSELYRVTLESEPAADAEHPGVVQISRTDLRRTQLRAALLELASSYLDHVSLEAEELSGVDVETKESLLRARRATISAARLDATRVTDCDALLLAGTSAINSRFDACQGTSRIYDVEATGCTFDGQLESDQSVFADGRFGVRARTQMNAWNTSSDNTIWCDQVEALRYSAGGITCTSCVGPLAKRGADACYDGEFTILELNSCRAMLEPNPCATFPRRPRPIDGL